MKILSEVNRPQRVFSLLLMIPMVIGLLSGCEPGDPYEKERLAIEKYMLDHNITAEAKPSGLYYIETKTGTGASASYGKRVKVKYTGMYTDGTVFDSNVYPFTLGMGQVIAGWDEGIAYMKEGGKATLIIPSKLAYGPDGYSDIPGYTPLVFEVELIDIL